MPASQLRGQCSRSLLQERDIIAWIRAQRGTAHKTHPQGSAVLLSRRNQAADMVFRLIMQPGALCSHHARTRAVGEVRQRAKQFTVDHCTLWKHTSSADSVEYSVNFCPPEHFVSWENVVYLPLPSLPTKSGCRQQSTASFQSLFQSPLPTAELRCPSQQAAFPHSVAQRTGRSSVSRTQATSWNDTGRKEAEVIALSSLRNQPLAFPHRLNGCGTGASHSWNLLCRGRRRAGAHFALQWLRLTQ